MKLPMKKGSFLPTNVPGVGWGGSCRGGAGCNMQGGVGPVGWGGVGHGGVGWVI